jgi:hypothetical protein
MTIPEIAMSKRSTNQTDESADPEHESAVNRRNAFKRLAAAAAGTAVGAGSSAEAADQISNACEVRNPYGGGPNTGISLPPYYRPTPSVANANTYFPGIEELGADEMRISFVGSSPLPPTRSQAGTAIMVELGNGKRFFFDLGPGCLRNLVALQVPAGLLSAEVEKGRHQHLLDQMLNVLEAMVSNTPAMETVRQRIRAELPSVFNLYRGEPIVMNRIIASTMLLISEIRGDPAHPVRVELDRYLSTFISRLRSSPELASRVETLKRDLLDRPELADLAAGTWNGLRDFLMRDVRSEESLLRRQFEAMLRGMPQL